jgi:hypothetical protein
MPAFRSRPTSLLLAFDLAPGAENQRGSVAAEWWSNAGGRWAAPIVEAGLNVPDILATSRADGKAMGPLSTRSPMVLMRSEASTVRC